MPKLIIDNGPWMPWDFNTDIRILLCYQTENDEYQIVEQISQDGELKFGCGYGYNSDLVSAYGIFIAKIRRDIIEIESNLTTNRTIRPGLTRLVDKVKEQYKQEVENSG